MEDDRIESFLGSVIWEKYLKLTDQWSIEASQLGLKRVPPYLMEQERKLPTPLLVAIRYYSFQFEIDNGGFEQYFYNVEPLIISETLRLFQETGLDASANVLSQAMSFFEQQYDWPSTQQERWLVWTDHELDSVPRRLAKLFDPGADRQRLYQFLMDNGYEPRS